ncbi:hypothetical protein [Streptomyces lunaelactis]|uniref:hypothetical protein n=1 Tax=Streptomyces lunaelactis TaxID=1535768 RepID=UPI0015855B5C|nr:hypothetical protein [Streptomyces lunaelactis]NUK23497.1 hypothetical protein [Streptomyces lunaelactis]
MAFLRTRTDRALADTYSNADIARLTGLSRGRISQLRASAEPDALPAPDGEGSAESRPLWNGDTVARWCASTGRRLPPRTASWLLPGPDGPHLRRVGQRTLHLRQEAPPAPFTGLGRPPVDVHVACYASPLEHAPFVWLATPLIPSETISLLGWPRPWPHGSPLHHLVHEILEQAEPDYAADTDLLGTLVLLPTSREANYSALSGHVRLLDLYQADADKESDDDLHKRLRQLRPDDRELTDLVAALGHRLPWWPSGCATPALVASWAPDAPRHVEHVPPPLSEAQAFVRRCESTAATLTGTLRTSVLELGRSWWDTSQSSWRLGDRGDHGELPSRHDPGMWQIAVEFQLPPSPAGTGDFWEGLEWVMEHAPSRRLAQDAFRIYGDPSSAGTVVLDPTTLPDPVRTALTGNAPAEQAQVSHRAQRALDALDAHPKASSGTILGNWPLPGGHTWCATAPGTPLMSVHVPRTMPAATEANSSTEAGLTVGSPLELVLTRTESTDSGTAPGVGFIITDQDQVLLLPALGRACDLAAAIEHVTWHPGKRTLVVGLMPSQNDQLIDAVEALLATGPRTTDWAQLQALVGPHPPKEDLYCTK